MLHPSKNWNDSIQLTYCRCLWGVTTHLMQASVTGRSVTQWTLLPVVAASEALQLERSDGFKALARRMLQSPEWQKVVGQPVDPQQTLLIQAAPGSGKSTLLREWCRGRPNNKILLLAFNKAVAKQLPGLVEMFISIGKYGKCTTWGSFREQFDLS